MLPSRLHPLRRDTSFQRLNVDLLPLSAAYLSAPARRQDEELERQHRPGKRPDRQRIEEIAASELQQLGENLRAVVSGAPRAIEGDTVASVGRMRVILLNAWLRPLLSGLSLFLGFSGGSWGLMHWLSTSIQSRIEALAVLEFQIEDTRETLTEIEETTWGG